MKTVNGGLRSCFSQVQCQITGNGGLLGGDGNNYCSASGYCVHAG